MVHATICQIFFYFGIFARRKNNIDLVLLDLTMPRLDGVEAYREIRKMREDIPVILFSGYNEKEATTRFAGKGPAGIIQKPLRSKTLITAVRESLKKSTQH